MASQQDFTLNQADDLVKYFVGSTWHAVETAKLGHIYFEIRMSGFPPSGATHGGSSWREAFRSAGVKLPYRMRFASVGKRVLVGQNEVAICTSKSYADRIARALNQREAD